MSFQEVFHYCFGQLGISWVYVLCIPWSLKVWIQGWQRVGYSLNQSCFYSLCGQILHLTDKYSHFFKGNRKSLVSTFSKYYTGHFCLVFFLADFCVIKKSDIKCKNNRSAVFSHRRCIIKIFFCFLSTFFCIFQRYAVINVF